MQQPSAAATHRVLRDVIAVPGNYCLYDRSGHRIDETVSWTAGRRRGPTPASIDPAAVVETVRERVTFGGLLPKSHFGHVLLEAFSRLWVFDAGIVAPGTPIVHFTHYGRDLEPFEQVLLDAALAGTRAPLRPVTRPIRIEKIVVPSQAIILEQPMVPAVIPVYDRIRDQLVGDVVPDDRPLYLSRSRLGEDRRRTLGERALEQGLEQRGVRVVHAQEHPLVEQIRMVASARTVIGLYGSALHLTILRDVEGARTISLDPRTPFAVQRDVDALRGSRFVHLHAQLPMHPRLPSGRSLEIGPYRNFMLPRRTLRALDRLL